MRIILRNLQKILSFLSAYKLIEKIGLAGDPDRLGHAGWRVCGLSEVDTFGHATFCLCLTLVMPSLWIATLGWQSIVFV